MLAITLLGNVPINRQVLQVSSRAPGTEWRRLRDRWERLHTLRVLLDLAGLSFLYVGTLSRSKRNAAPGREVVG